VFGDSITDWVNIDADMMLFTFLPPLIFGEAMNLNFYHFKGGLLQALLLAGPGVLIGAALLGVVTKYMLPYDWSWNLALTFGSILAATDTVAMVALLNSASASPKLTMLIVAESLLNDGTAMVLFTVFYESLRGHSYTVGGVTFFFVAATLGSVLFGLLCGFIIVRWLRTANRPLKEIDTTIQIAITISCAYLIFFIAQYVLQISGPLACCWAGIMLAWMAPPIILNHDTMHHVWGMVEWTLNTLIFLLAGLIIGNRVIDKVSAIDWIYVVLLYGALVVIRFVVILLLFPWLSTWGHKCTKQEAVFMGWAGLRGVRLSPAFYFMCRS
jgi:NhaP-type Na+/H+ or K+/H+ antiporter